MFEVECGITFIYINMKATNTKQKTNWVSIITFYSLACLFSWPFFWWRDIESESWALWNAPGLIKTASYMWGPGLSAIICFFIFKKTHQRTITFFGTSTIKSLLFWFVPIIALSIFSLRGIDALVLPFTGFLITLGEELGWRGYLQDALRKVSPLQRYITIGVLWELWHFTNRMSGGWHISTFIRVGIFIIALIIISYVMGILTDKTKSLAIAVTFHAWINILFEVSTLNTYIVFGLSLPFWTYLIWTWEKPLRKNKASSVSKV